MTWLGLFETDIKWANLIWGQNLNVVSRTVIDWNKLD